MKMEIDDNESFKVIDKHNKDKGLITRPSASNAFWLCSLIPMSYMVNTWNPNQSVHFDYKLSTIISFGLFLQSIAIFLSLKCQSKNKLLGLVSKLISGSITSFLVWICLKQGIVFSVLSGFSTTIVYNILYHQTLKALPRSFTLGEASIVVQGCVIFFYNAFLQLPEYYWTDKNVSDLIKINTILQVGLLGVTCLASLLYLFKCSRNSIVFYLLLIVMTVSVMIFPIARTPAAIVLFEFLTNDIQRIFVIGAYMLLLAITASFVIWKVNKNDRSTTETRKIFHILICLVYLPGLVYQCSLLYLASGVMLAVFIILEAARVIKVEPVHEYLNIAVNCFVDEKDAGHVALTPLYLLIGCSLPIWLHPSPCNLTDSAGFALLLLTSGIMSIGIGDTAASVIGFRFGKHKWPKSIKSVEGTIAGIVLQALLVFCLFKCGLIKLNTIKMAITGIAIIINSLVEAKTDQVDNLILPLITFIILGMSY